MKVRDAVGRHDPDRAVGVEQHHAPRRAQVRGVRYAVGAPQDHDLVSVLGGAHQGVGRLPLQAAHLDIDVGELLPPRPDQRLQVVEGTLLPHAEGPSRAPRSRVSAKASASRRSESLWCLTAASTTPVVCSEPQVPGTETRGEEHRGGVAHRVHARPGPVHAHHHASADRGLPRARHRLLALAHRVRSVPSGDLTCPSRLRDVSGDPGHRRPRSRGRRGRWYDEATARRGRRRSGAVQVDGSRALLRDGGKVDSTLVSTGDPAGGHNVPARPGTCGRVRVCRSRRPRPGRRT